ncbi:hypothetical protein ABW19_dt0206312 [Dactylella cylindrospora]|nr:hypothetical protein ABW19_dt0206312 [Dactylella cylindrospora]
MAGTGKSTIARTVARELHLTGALGATFFFSRGSSECGNANILFATLAFQLADNLPGFREHLDAALSADGDIQNKNFADQWKKLVQEPMENLIRGLIAPIAIVIILDALDECDDRRDVKLVIRLIEQAQIAKFRMLKVLVTSRPEDPIEDSFRSISADDCQRVILHDVSTEIVKSDLILYLRHQFDAIKNSHNGISGEWPTEAQIEALAVKADSLFIYAATVCRFIGDGLEGPVAQLETVLNEATGTGESATMELDRIYLQVLQQSLLQGYNEQQKSIQSEKSRMVFASLVLSFDTLALGSIAKLNGLSEAFVKNMLRRLGAVIDVPDSRESHVRLLHPSFRDFLVDPYRCTDPYHFVHAPTMHEYLFDKCFDIMAASLKQDVLSVGRPDAEVEKVDMALVNKHLPEHIQYACRYWFQHFVRITTSVKTIEKAHRFLSEYLLQWMEALCWIRNFDGILRMSDMLSEYISLYKGKFTSLFKISSGLRRDWWLDLRVVKHQRDSLSRFAPNSRAWVLHYTDYGLNGTSVTTIQSWDLMTGKMIWELHSPEDFGYQSRRERYSPLDIITDNTIANTKIPLSVMSISPDSMQLLFVRELGSPIIIYDYESGEALKKIHLPEVKILYQALFTSNEDILVLAGFDDRLLLRLIDWRTGGVVRDVQVGLAAQVGEGNVDQVRLRRICDPLESESIRDGAALRLIQGQFYDSGVEKHIICVSYGRGFEIWDAALEKRVHARLLPECLSILEIEISSRYGLLACLIRNKTKEATLALFDVKSGLWLNYFQIEADLEYNPVTSLTFLNTEKMEDLIAFRFDNEVQVLDFRSSRLRYRIVVRGLRGFEISPNERFFLLTTEDDTHVYDIASLAQFEETEMGKPEETQASFRLANRDFFETGFLIFERKCISGREGSTIQILDTTGQLKLTETFELPGSFLASVATTLDGCRVVVIVTALTLTVWDATCRSFVRSIPVRLSPDLHENPRYVSLGGQFFGLQNNLRMFYVWDLRAGSLVAEAIIDDWIMFEALSFTHDNSFLVCTVRQPVGTLDYLDIRSKPRDDCPGSRIM